MLLQFVWVGKTRNPHLKSLLQDYVHRLEKWVPVQVVELKEERTDSGRPRETERILRTLRASLTSWRDQELAMRGLPCGKLRVLHGPLLCRLRKPVSGHHPLFRGHRNLAVPLACRLQSVYENEPGLTADVIVPLPLHRRRLRERGYNQALLLARPLARGLGLALEPYGLLRIRATLPQSGSLLEARRENMRGAFVVPRPERILGKTVLPVDDVFTTGATLNEAARTLLTAGAEEVKAVTLARAIRSA